MTCSKTYVKTCLMIFIKTSIMTSLNTRLNTSLHMLLRRFEWRHQRHVTLPGPRISVFVNCGSALRAIPPQFEAELSRFSKLDCFVFVLRVWNSLVNRGFVVISVVVSNGFAPRAIPPQSKAELSRVFKLPCVLVFPRPWNSLRNHGLVQFIHTLDSGQFVYLVVDVSSF